MSEDLPIALEPAPGAPPDLDLSRDVQAPAPEPEPASAPPVPLAGPAPDAEAAEARWRGPLDEKLILNAGAPPAAVEQYRKAAASLHQLQIDRGIKIVMIASALAEEGKTITASNIALTLSESFRRRVLLIDADLRRPSIHAMFGTPNATGLIDALQAPEHEKLTIFEVTGQLSVLPAGPPKLDPISSLVSERMRMILDEAGAKFDWVVIDTPPVGVLADARLLAEMVHAVVLVVGAGRTPYRAIQHAVDAIDRKRIAGVVLNRVVEHSAGYQDYDYYVGPSGRG